jgi:predicted ATPase
VIPGSNPGAPVLDSREPFLRSLQIDRAAIGDPSAYPFSIPALANLAELDLDPHVTFLAGANAAGKSTLIEAIAVAAGLNPEGGSRNFTFSTRASRPRSRPSASLRCGAGSTSSSPRAASS